MSSALRLSRFRQQETHPADFELEGAALERECDGVRLAVYRAKPARKPWANPALRELVGEARGAFRAAYGPQVSIYDDYDDKAWVYIASACYEHRGLEFSEYLTLRFVPAAGSPTRNDDLNFYYRKSDPDRSLVDLLAERTDGATRSNLLSACYSQSRMGAIRPRAAGGISLSGNRHIHLTWCLMLECFLQDMARAGEECWFLTSQITEQLRLALGCGIPMRPFHELMALDKGSIVLKRKDAYVRNYCYSVPTYFLNLRDVSAVLTRLMHAGELSPAVVEDAVTPGFSVARALRQPSASAWQRLNFLLTARGKLQGSRITGEELRDLMDDEVLDAPVLRLTPIGGVWAELDKLSLAAASARPSSYIRELGPIRALG